MKNPTSKLSLRWSYLVIGVIAMLFAGILYAWSILKSPLASDFGWSASKLALNFTLAMSCFCIGGLFGAQISKRLGHKIALITAGILSAAFLMLLGLTFVSLILNIFIRKP
jgi:OFA family oxalate/formate antiporter-like MFS transporter